MKCSYIFVKWQADKKGSSPNTHINLQEIVHVLSHCWFKNNGKVYQKLLRRPHNLKQSPNQITILCPAKAKLMVLNAYGPQAIKLIKQIGKKIQEATGEKHLLFISSRVSQWQYKKAMLSALGVAPKKRQQA